MNGDNVKFWRLNSWGICVRYIDSSFLIIRTSMQINIYLHQLSCKLGLELKSIFTEGAVIQILIEFIVMYLIQNYSKSQFNKVK